MKRYETYVFDCDGVVLDSNRLKTDAFRLAAIDYGDAAADALVAHHVANGGISRFAKFRHFVDEIVPDGAMGPGYEELLDRYARAVREGLENCAIADGLHALREATPDARWLIVSGGSQAELREIFGLRDLDGLFDQGIFGSPDTKDEILSREIQSGRIAGDALFIGDSRYDYRAAHGAGLDFTFATYWTEVHDWPEFTSENNIKTIGSLREIMP